MRVFLTGSYGFLGTNLIHYLNDRGHEVGGLDLPTPETYALEAMGPFESYQHFPGDVRRHEDLNGAIHLFEPDVLVHLAAVSTVQAAHENARRTWNTNVLGTVNVLEICRERDLPVIVASSDKAYGIQKPPFVETMPLSPLFPYDVSKAAADMITLSYARTYDVPAIVTRSCNYYGPGDLHWNRLVPGVFKALAMGEAPRLHALMGDVKREWIHVSDVCEAYRLLATKLLEEPHTVQGLAYNIGSGDILTRDDLVHKLLAAAGKPDIQPIPEEPAAAELGDEYLNHSRIANLGWHPTIPLDRGLQETWTWYREYFGKESRT